MTPASAHDLAARAHEAAVAHDALRTAWSAPAQPIPSAADLERHLQGRLCRDVVLLGELETALERHAAAFGDLGTRDVVALVDGPPYALDGTPRTCAAAVRHRGWTEISAAAYVPPHQRPWRGLVPGGNVTARLGLETILAHELAHDIWSVRWFECVVEWARIIEMRASWRRDSTERWLRRQVSCYAADSYERYLSIAAQDGRYTRLDHGHALQEAFCEIVAQASHPDYVGCEMFGDLHREVAFAALEQVDAVAATVADQLAVAA